MNSGVVSGESRPMPDLEKARVLAEQDSLLSRISFYADNLMMAREMQVTKSITMKNGKSATNNLY